jgi:Fe-S protein assembly co-chaperone HscB
MEEENDEPLDYFDTLGIERSYHLDIPTLKKAYKKLMKKLHPDLHRNQSEEEQDDIHDQASNVTRAYRTLLEPQHRALHLLELMGKPLDERTTASLLGQDFLMEIMEIREAIDTTSKQAEIQALVQKIKSQIAATANELADAFDTKDLELALRLTAELQYWNRCMDTLREKPCFGCWKDDGQDGCA